jgi:iron complex outermembrane recepter protein
MQNYAIPRFSAAFKVRLVLTPICAAVMQAHAAGQAAPTPESETLTVVVVEARKVKENIQTVPVAVTSYTGEELIKQGVFEFNEVARATPNVLIRAHAGGANSSIIAIRGQVNNDVVGTVDSPVGVYIDGVVAARPSGLNAAMVDLQSIETLKGPQGTLFGRNTTGGAILIKTNDPEKEFGGKVTAEVGSDNLRHLTGVLNVPMMDGKAALRFVVDKLDRDGFVSDKTGREWNDSHSKLARVKLLVKPSATSSIVATLEAIDAEASVIAQSYTVGREASLSNLVAPSIAPLNFAKQRNFSLVASNEFDWGVLKLTAGRRKLETLSVIDLAMLGFVLANTTQSKPNGEQNSVELQASGRTFGDRLGWTAGVYSFKETAAERQYTDYSQAAIGLSGTRVTGDVVSKTRAAYLQGNFNIFDATKLTVGVRHSNDEKSLVGSYLTFGLAPAFSRLEPATGGSAKFGNTNYVVSLDHTFDKDKLVYLTRSTGYRAGGFSLNTAFASFAPEDVVNSEIGLKSEWLGRKLRINAALYKQDYTNFQTTLVSGSPPVRSTQNANGEIKGGEVEVSAVPLKGMRAGLTYGRTDARYVSTALAGNPFAYIPKTTSSLFASYRKPVSLGNWESRIDYSRTSEINFNNGTTAAKVPGYALLNLRTTLEMDNWDVSLWVKNARDERYYSIALTAIGTIAWAGMPRTAGVTVSYAF